MLFEALIGNEKPLVEQVSDKIIQMIADQNLVAGEKLPNEFDMANRFHVGRGTVREAVKLLVSRNILEIQRGKGTFVTATPGVMEDPLGLAFFHDKYKLALDLIEIRMIMEPQIAALAATKATAEEVAEMWRLCGRIEQQLEAGQDYTQCDVDLHTCIAKSTRNLVMPNLIPIITYGIVLYNEFPYEVDRKDALQVHRDLIGAIENRQPAEARKAMEHHLSYNVRNLAAIKAKMGK